MPHWSHGSADQCFYFTLAYQYQYPFLKVMNVCVLGASVVVAFGVLAGEPMLTRPEDQTRRRLLMDGYGRRQIPTVTLPNLELATRSQITVVSPPRSLEFCRCDRADPVDALPMIQSNEQLEVKATVSDRACYRYTVSRFRWVCYLESCRHEAQHGHRDDQVGQYSTRKCW